MEPLLLSHAAMVLAELQVLEKSAAPKPSAPKAVHPRRQHMARPMPIPAPQDHAFRHVGQLVKETPSLGFSSEQAAAAAAVQRTPQYLDNLNVISGAPPTVMERLHEAKRMLQGKPPRLDPQRPLMHTLLPTAAGRQFGQTGNFTPELTSEPVGMPFSDLASAPSKFQNLARAAMRAGAPP
jgi:hypothetical protein